jgi:hypothetical protein
VKTITILDGEESELASILHDTIASTCVPRKAQVAESVLNRLNRSESQPVSSIAAGLRGRGDLMSDIGAVYIDELVAGIKLVLENRKQIHDYLSDPAGDGTGDGAHQPDGGTYGELYDAVGYLETLIRNC